MKTCFNVPFYIVCFFKYNQDLNSDDAAYQNQSNQMDGDSNAHLGMNIMNYQVICYGELI